MAGLSTLKMLGRRGDTQVGHLTQGEMVVPTSAQTPTVKAAIASAMRRTGVNPAQYVVGSAFNSRNPATGALEFADTAGIRSLTPYTGDPYTYGFGPQHTFFSTPQYGSFPSGPGVAPNITTPPGTSGSGALSNVIGALPIIAGIDSLTGGHISDAVTSAIPNPVSGAYNDLTTGINNLFTPGGQAVLDAAGGPGGTLGNTIGVPNAGLFGDAANIVGNTGATTPIDFGGAVEGPGVGAPTTDGFTLGGAPTDIIGGEGSADLAGGGIGDLLGSTGSSLFSGSSLMGLTGGLGAAVGTGALIPLTLAPELGTLGATLGGLGLGAEGLTLGGSAAAAAGGAGSTAAGIGGVLGAAAPFLIPAGIFGAIMLAKKLNEKPPVGPVGHTNIDLDPATGTLTSGGTGAKDFDPSKVSSYTDATMNVLNNLVNSNAVTFDSWSGNVGYYKGNYGYIQKGTDAGKGVPRDNNPNVSALNALNDHIAQGFATVQNPEVLKNYVRTIGQVEGIDVEKELKRLDDNIAWGIQQNQRRDTNAADIKQYYKDNPEFSNYVNQWYTNAWSPTEAARITAALESGNTRRADTDWIYNLRSLQDAEKYTRDHPVVDQAQFLASLGGGA